MFPVVIIPAAAVLNTQRFPLRGQVAQLVERSPEKAGVGGSIPSLATIQSITCTLIRNSLRPKTSQFAYCTRAGTGSLSTATLGHRP